jgi:hypothetical protein
MLSEIRFKKKSKNHNIHNTLSQNTLYTVDSYVPCALETSLADSPS